MNRRELLQSLAGLTVVGAITPAKTEPHKFGFLDVRGHTSHQRITGEFLRVSINGIDVTDRCCEADDVKGYVVVYCTDQGQHRWDVGQGAKHVVSRGGPVCRHRIEGAVVIAPGKKEG